MSIVSHNQSAMDYTEDKTISIGPHWSYGWLRRPELDETFGYAYEDAEGDLVYVQGEYAKKWIRLKCCEDAKTGERYLCLYKQPAP